MSDAPTSTESRSSLPSAAQDQGAKPESILVVDDSEANRQSLLRRLKRHGYLVDEAADGESAIQYLSANRADLVLLDVMMPGISGLEVLRHIRSSDPPERLPVIMATAMDASEDIVTALGMGANDYITKPLDFPVVLARVRTQLALKKAVGRILDLEAQLSRQNAELNEVNRELNAAAARTRQDLESAARVQEAFLPTAPPPGADGWKFAWHYKPCEALAGDALNVFTLNTEHIGLYVLDVSGHGVTASLLAVTATRLLSETDGAESIVLRNENGVELPVDPAQVAQTLARRFSWNDLTNQFFTLFYAVLNIRTRDLTYVSAGHPGAIWLSDGSSPRVLEGSGLPIGVGEHYKQDRVRLNPGDRLYLYSDGVTEAMGADYNQFGIRRLSETLRSKGAAELGNTIADVLSEVQEWSGGLPIRDDISMLALEAPMAGAPPSDQAIS